MIGALRIDEKLKEQGWDNKNHEIPGEKRHNA